MPELLDVRLVFNLAAISSGRVQQGFLLVSRFSRARREAVRAQGLRYGLPQLDALHHSRFEDAIQDLMRRDGCRDAQRVGGGGDLGADVTATDPPGGAAWSSASTAATAPGARRWARRICRSSMGRPVSRDDAHLGKHASGGLIVRGGRPDLIGARGKAVPALKRVCHCLQGP
jgi:hypothetical protein